MGIEMFISGELQIDPDVPCHGCGKPLVTEADLVPEIAGIECPDHEVTHVYHMDCLPPEMQVELMLARMKNQGMI